jgi:hypothetical protein
MNIKQKLDYVFSHIESISIRLFVGFAVFLLSLTTLTLIIAFLSIALSFSNVILSIFWIALLPVFHYIGKNILEQIDDSDQL